MIFPFALELPSVPRNVTATFLNQSAIGLSWKSPEIIGDQSHVFYDVSCLRPCNNDAQTKCAEEPCQNDVKYIPFNKGLNTTTVLVTNLSPFVNYTFKIYARNRVSEVAKRRHGIEGDFSVITVTTIGKGKSVWKKTTKQTNTITTTKILPPPLTLRTSFQQRKLLGFIYHCTCKFISA